MIDVRIEDSTIIERQGISGDNLEVLTEAATLVAYVLNYLSEDETAFDLLKNTFISAVGILEFGVIREGPQPLPGYNIYH